METWRYFFLKSTTAILNTPCPHCPLWQRLSHHFQEFIDDLVAGDPFRLGSEIWKNAMSQHGMRDFAYIFDLGSGASAHNRRGLCAEHQVLAGARRTAPRYPFANEVRCLLF